MGNKSNSTTCRRDELEAGSASKNGQFLVSNVHPLLDGSTLPSKLIFRYCYTMWLRKYFYIQFVAVCLWPATVQCCAKKRLFTEDLLNVGSL